MRAAIYTRLSQDPRQTGLGVERQLEDCQEYCRLRGWEIVAEYCDNDTTAWKDGVKRPAYDALIDSIKAGQWDWQVPVL
ncbi:Resolvase, N terminal domain [Nakamurella panacisegetis]|uniref:Resolvase, N terminal domain n=1 Tax=Nakamurella panacisegetis TaxID=1090615 RepID=A0A1H0NB26_9ACTN|nr:Resolvase, N terminal domain [Nakamurella panacisegetis]